MIHWKILDLFLSENIVLRFRNWFSFTKSTKLILYSSYWINCRFICVFLSEFIKNWNFTLHFQYFHIISKPKFAFRVTLQQPPIFRPVTHFHAHFTIFSVRKRRIFRFRTIPIPIKRMFRMIKRTFFVCYEQCARNNKSEWHGRITPTAYVLQ